MLCFSFVVATLVTVLALVPDARPHALLLPNMLTSIAFGATLICQVGRFFGIIAAAQAAGHSSSICW